MATRLLFVCLGNICRSPAAEGTFRHLVRERGLESEFEIDSAGTGAYHVGDPPNGRATATAARRGIRLEGAARQFKARDFDRFDLILAMDRSNYEDILSLARDDEQRGRVRLYRSFDPEVSGSQIPDVPDPYYGGQSGFEQVQDIMERTSAALLDEVHGAR